MLNSFPRPKESSSELLYFSNPQSETPLLTVSNRSLHSRSKNQQMFDIFCLEKWLKCLIEQSFSLESVKTFFLKYYSQLAGAQSDILK